jgi:hypothetical protein
LAAKMAREREASRQLPQRQGQLLLSSRRQKRGTIEVIESFRATVNRQSFLRKFLHKSALFARGG